MVALLRVFTPPFFWLGVGLDPITDDPFEVGVTEPTVENSGFRVVPTNVINGDVTLTTGQTFSGNIVNGRIKVPISATGTIIIEDNFVDASGIPGVDAFNVIDINPSTSATVLVRYNEIKGRVSTIGIGVRKFTAYRNYIHHVEDGLRIHNFNSSGSSASDVTAEGNYMGPFLSWTPDPLITRSDTRTHSDGIQIEGCDGTVIRGNAIHAMATTDGTSNVEWARDASPYDSLPAGTSGGRPHPQVSNGIIITPNVSPVTNLVIDKNWIYGGEWGFNAGNNLNSTTTAEVTDNRFDRNQWFQVASRVINIDSSDSTAPYRIQTSGNVYMDDGSPVYVGRNG